MCDFHILSSHYVILWFFSPEFSSTPTVLSQYKMHSFSLLKHYAFWICFLFSIKILGPFLSILLNRLANMHNNCFFTNLLLTDIFAALASYPCPLLYEYLLNPIGLSIKPSVNTLYKVCNTKYLLYFSTGMNKCNFL